MTPTNRFLWGYETTYYTDNTSESTTPHVIGVYGAAGANGKLLYGTCSTTAGTAEKAVVCSEATELYSGLTITVKFSTANTANVPTLNVNQLGAKAIWVDNVVTSSTNSLFWNTNALITFMYDGTQFVVVDQATTYYTTCTTGATTTAKAAACAACVVRKGTTVTVQMTNAHTGTSAATLYVNGQSGTARTIYINGATVTNAAGNSWAAGEAVAFVFNGQYWYASKGADGADGTDGRGVVSSSVTYQIHSSGTTAPTGTWSSTVPETTITPDLSPALSRDLSLANHPLSDVPPTAYSREIFSTSRIS